jgi:glycosyltransferase involved in cell wall biosynthesis
LADALSITGNQIQVIAPYPSRPKGFKFDEKYKSKNFLTTEIINSNLSIVRIPSFLFSSANPFGRLYESISFGIASFRYILNNNFQADKVYMNTWPLFGQLGVAMACKKRYIPYVIHIQDVYPESLINKLPKFLQKIIFYMLLQVDRYILQNSVKIVVISEQMKKHLASSRKVENTKIEVVLNWQNVSDYENYQDFIPANPNPVFMYLGNMGPVAGLHTVIKAFKAANISAKLILAGNGSQKEVCLRLANSHPNIEFWDVPAGKVALIQSKADVVILPMRKGAASSSIPSKLISYMTSARPIIVLADRNSDTRNIVINADCGWTGDAEDEGWLKQTFINITKIPQKELLQKGNNGRIFCINNFSKESNLNKLINTILHD